MVFVELIIATLKRLVMQMPTVLDVFSSFYPSLSPKEMILFTRHTRYRRDMAGTESSNSFRPTLLFLFSH